MKRFGLLLAALVCGLGLVSGASSANAGMIFATNFDNTPDRNLSPPYVGSGVLSFNNMLSDGTYLLSSFANLAFSFTFGGESFTLLDISSSTPSLAVTIYQSGTDWYFDGPNVPFRGAVEFTNVNKAIVTFFPNDFPGAVPPFNLFFAEIGPDIFFGTYGVNATTAVPEPGTLTLCAIGGLGCVIGVWRRRRATAG